MDRWANPDKPVIAQDDTGTARQVMEVRLLTAYKRRAYFE